MNAFWQATPAAHRRRLAEIDVDGGRVTTIVPPGGVTGGRGQPPASVIVVTASKAHMILSCGEVFQKGANVSGIIQY